MAEDEEDDYMSETFLTQTESVKPGLARGETSRINKQTKRHKAANEKHKFKPLKQREQEERDKGLKNALTSDNKGFALLQKMGYKKGMGLGKKGTGRAEPVPIEVKADRGGLGRGADMKRKQQMRERWEMEAMRKRQKMAGELRGDFKQRMRDKFDDKKVSDDLYNSQKTCQYLDGSKGFEEPLVSWYWPPQPVVKLLEDDDIDGVPYEEKEKEEEEEEEEEEDGDECSLTLPEQLEELTKYLRTTYYYCVWCGATYDDEKDLDENCPGNTHEDHN